MKSFNRTLLALVFGILCVIALSGCGEPVKKDPPVTPPTDTAKDAITYLDDLTKHIGCTTDGMTYTAATIDGYPCAAKMYEGQADASKPIVLLIHGNSDTPAVWEKVEGGEDMLSEKLVAAGYKTYAIDLRYDKVDEDPKKNPAKNMSHEWSVPIVQKFIRVLFEANPDRKFVFISHSFGVTSVRDALRRLQVNDKFYAWKQIKAIIHGAGANHGVATFALCATDSDSMRGRVACEMGNREAYSPTDFLKPLNGPSGSYEVPCIDGKTAFGQEGVCGDNKVEHITIVMKDIEQGTYQDKFVSEASSALKGAQNLTIGLDDFDNSGYFFDGLLKNHYGPVRHANAHKMILDAIAK